MTEAALNDREFRELAVEMVSGPQGFGITSSLVIVETAHVDGTDRSDKTRTPISLDATPPIPVTESHLALERVRSSDTVVYVAAPDVIDPRDGTTELDPEPGWEFEQKSKSYAVVAVPRYESGFESALHELVLRGLDG